MKQQIYAIVKNADGTITKRPVNLTRDNWKLGRKMVQDVQSGLWLYKQKYEYQDKKNMERSG